MQLVTEGEQARVRRVQTRLQWSVCVYMCEYVNVCGICNGSTTMPVIL